jgi:hypothetical protein
MDAFWDVMYLPEGTSYDTYCSRESGLGKSPIYVHSNEPVHSHVRVTRRRVSLMASTIVRRFLS